MTDALTPEEVELWRGFLRWSEQTTAAVGADIAAMSNLSVPDFEVAIRLQDAGGALAQLALGDALGWSASRLSHQLSRMEKRDLISRTSLGRGRTMNVELTENGFRELSDAREIHAQSVRRNFLAPLDAQRARPDFAAICVAAMRSSGDRAL